MSSIHCKRCGKRVVGTTIIKHLWAKHREVMMKNHVGGMKAKAAKKVAGPVMVIPHYDVSDAGRGTFTTMPSAPLAPLVKRPRFSYTPGAKTTVVLFQGANRVEIQNVTMIETLE
jgi:hypothetical protein